MKFGILFTSHPNTDTEPYPHRDVHARVTRTMPGLPSITSATNTALCRTCSSMRAILRA